MAASVSLSSTAGATLGCSQDPINRRALCPKGAALLDFVKAPARLFIPNIGRPAGRKLAIQILEYFDRTGMTIREGHLRRLSEDRLETLKGRRWIEFKE